MREILFRGKRLDNGEWVCGAYQPPVEWGGKKWDVSIAYVTEHGWLGDILVIPETVGQFVGLLDKNGKKIFEGDVVKATIRRDEGFTESIRNEKGVIAFDSLGMIGLMVDREDDDTPVWTDFFFELSISGCILDYCFEVIGNIHDNPDLLKGGAEDEKSV